MYHRGEDSYCTYEHVSELPALVFWYVLTDVMEERILLDCHAGIEEISQKFNSVFSRLEQIRRAQFRTVGQNHYH
jgi:hypothetical protein